ncbi:MAG TPA: pyridoxal-phosphate dependent enzyme [Burkholderiaceae bacterium]|nr:pyridoxal-phosphate dependent enzyme [Burkholderiaceae bacterium]
MAQRFDELIDRSIPSEESLIRRYHKIFELEGMHDAPGRAALARTSRTEGARVFELAEVGGVRIVACDESSRMTTGTYKDLDACLICAHALETGLDALVLSSAGNLGRAVSRYSAEVGLRVFLFHPKTTLHKLDAASFGRGNTKVVCVDLPEPEVKSLAKNFARRHGLPHVPDTRLRLAASATRAMHLLEITAEWGPIDCIAQTVCAAYGPLGIYACFSKLLRHGFIRRSHVPRFLGFQQEANAPITQSWIAGSSQLPEPGRGGAARPDTYIEPGLYNTHPADSYGDFFNLMRRFGCEMAAVSSQDYARYAPVMLEHFDRSDFRFARCPRSGEIVEKAGLLTGIGILKAIDERRLVAGESVVYLLTGGSRSAGAGVLTPDAQVDASRSEQAWIESLGESFSLSAEAVHG